MIKKILIYPLLIISAIAGIVYYVRREPPKVETLTVKRGSVVQEVIVTGKIQPSEDVDLAFEKAGKVRKVYFKIGDTVREGDVIAELDRTELSADLLQAEAAVATQRAKLDELKRGTRPEAIRIQEVKVRNAEVALEDAKQNLIDALRDAYTRSDNAVRNLIDQLFDNPRSVNPQISIVNFYGEQAAESRRLLVEQSLISWASLAEGAGSAARPSDRIPETKKNLEEVRGFADLMALGTNSLTASGGLSQTTIDGYKTDISTARTNVNTAISNLSTAEEKFRGAESALLLQQNQLMLDSAGTSAEEIAAQSAQVAEAEAKVAGIRAQIEKMFLRSPIAGIVTKQDATPGEIVVANTIIASVISTAGLEIEVFVPEVDIGRVTIGDPVAITIDAFSGEDFSGRILYIEPGETIVDGVVNFKIVVDFTRHDTRLKSGLTANLRIETMRRNNVLVLPQFAIIEKDEGTFVRKPDAEEDTSVTVGIRSRDGLVEILSGVAEGDVVVNIGFK
mgnify:CR=1 FL=1